VSVGSLPDLSAQHTEEVELKLLAFLLLLLGTPKTSPLFFMHI